MALFLTKLVIVLCSLDFLNLILARNLDILYNPLLSGITSYTVATTFSYVTKQTPCIVTTGIVTTCRRKRGLEEKPVIIRVDNEEISPAEVLRLETSRAPVFGPRVAQNEDLNILYSSISNQYRNSAYKFRDASDEAWRKSITVGDCGGSVVDLSGLLTCIGLTVQQTTVLTATYTRVFTVSEGFNTMTVGGCTPYPFPYQFCPTDAPTIIIGDLTTSNPSSATSESSQFDSSSVTPTSTSDPITGTTESADSTTSIVSSTTDGSADVTSTSTTEGSSSANPTSSTTSEAPDLSLSGPPEEVLNANATQAPSEQ